MRTPVVLLTGVDAASMAGAMVSLQFDLPGAVAVRHEIDVEAQTLLRVVSDLSGVVETERIDLAHACVSCAIREDVVPTLERLAATGRWQTIVAHLPVGAEARQVCGVLAWDTRLARRLRIASVVTALSGAGLADSLLGEDLLVERGVQTSDDDRRGVGEVACAMVEYADVVVLDGLEGEIDRDGWALVRTLARPDAAVVRGVVDLTADLVLSRRHQHGATEAWAGNVLEAEAPQPAGSMVWRLDLRSEHAFDPVLLLDDIEVLGAGRHRSRGCFWLPTRPGDALAWDGAGGQLSIGLAEPWGRRRPFTRLLLIGLGTPPLHLIPEFDRLLAPGATARATTGTATAEDGFEPWLGPIEGVA
ncbi:GTP-binding protein [Nocardioides sp.]|uniref:GTP-binding protein n=1 Tax=Nocardioides sp. TaxID=35761 RepID=UPI003518E187